MGRRFFSFSALFFLLLVSQAAFSASAREPRSIKPDLSAVSTFNRAMAAAQNYGLHIFSAHKEYGNTSLVAYNPETKEGVYYTSIYFKTAGRIIEVCYYNLDNESGSEIRFYEERCTLILKNSSELIDFQTSSYTMTQDVYEKYTQLLAIQRELLKESVTESFGMEFFDDISANHIRKEKLPSGKSVFYIE